VLVCWDEERWGLWGVVEVVTKGGCVGTSTFFSIAARLGVTTPPTERPTTTYSGPPTLTPLHIVVALL
jgi:hypothetical protein